MNSFKSVLRNVLALIFLLVVTVKVFGDHQIDGPLPHFLQDNTLD